MSASVAARGTDTAEGFRASLGRFGAPGIVAILAILLGTAMTPPLGAALILAWAWLSHTPIQAFGVVRPRSWTFDIAVGILFGVGLKLLLKAVILPLLGADPVNHAGRQIIGSSPVDIAIFFAYVFFGAGFSEELCFRGYFFERLGKLLGRSAAVNLLGLLLSSALFAAVHFQQGRWGVINALFTGLAFGSVFLLNGRRLFLLMVAHASFDLVAAMIILTNVEKNVAHLFFK